MITELIAIQNYLVITTSTVMKCLFYVIGVSVMLLSSGEMAIKCFRGLCWMLLIPTRVMTNCISSLRYVQALLQKKNPNEVQKSSASANHYSSSLNYIIGIRPRHRIEVIHSFVASS